MIWSDNKIIDMAERGMIEPFDERQLNPASYNLRLANKIRIPLPNMMHYKPVARNTHFSAYLTNEMEFETHVLSPGEFCLCCSVEYVRLPVECSGVLYSRSSMGRIGLEHLHAGYVDPGFHGQLVFEFHNNAPWPIMLEAGEQYMQIVFEAMDCAPGRSYAQTGRYWGQTGVQPARIDPLPRLAQ